MRDLIGQRFGERYTVREQVGVGGMAVVYRAFDEKLETDVALKVLKSELVESGELNVDLIVSKFEQEVRLVLAVESTHIVQILDRGKQDGLFYYAMKFVSGGSLTGRLKQRGGPLEVAEAIEVLRQVGGALQRAHDVGVLHRDIKPSNILVQQSRSGALDYFLADFGIAKAVEDTSLPAHTITSSGTPGYMSPEQAFGDPVDQRADVFSLGVTAYQMVTGQLPFKGDTLPAVMRAVNTQDPVPPSRLNPKVTPLLDSAILKAMKRVPDQRFASVKEFVAACEVVAAVAEPGGTVITPGPKADREDRGYRMPALLAAVVLLLLAIAGAAWWLVHKDGGPGPKGPKGPPPSVDGGSEGRGQDSQQGSVVADVDGPSRAEGGAEHPGDSTPVDSGVGAPPVATPEPIKVLLCSSAEGFEDLAAMMSKSLSRADEALRGRGVEHVECHPVPYGEVVDAATLQGWARAGGLAWILHLHASTTPEPNGATLSVEVVLREVATQSVSRWTLGPANFGRENVAMSQREGAYAELVDLLLWNSEHEGEPHLSRGATTFVQLLPEVVGKLPPKGG